MNVGEALVVCTVLVLAVFRPDFRKFLLWAVGVGAALCVLSAGIWWAWSVYHSHVEQVAAAKHRVAANACVKRLTGIDPNTTQDTLPANWFATIDACEGNPETARAVPDYQTIACENGALDPACNSRPYSSVVEIRGGETLKQVRVSNPPKSQRTNGLQLDPTSFTPLVYLGHNQKFVFACGVFGEQRVPTKFPTITNSTRNVPVNSCCYQACLLKNSFPENANPLNRKLVRTAHLVHDQTSAFEAQADREAVEKAMVGRLFSPAVRYLQSSW